MDIRLTNRVQRIKPSPTLAVTARAAELRAAGKDIIGLGAGEPDFDTPEHIKAAAIEAINAGQTKYTAVDGTAELKKAIQAKFKRDQALDYELNEILVSVGAKHSLMNLFNALVDHGDEVIILAPYWVSYVDMALLNGGTPVIVEASQEKSFKVTPEQLEAAITPKSKLLVFNSPSNPTGVAYTKAELAALGEVLKRHPHVVVASDDIYEHILWSDEPFNNIVTACPELKDRAVVINGVSKAYAMTGWRIGYAAGPRPLIGAMNKLQSQSTSNPTSIAQAAAAAALNGDQGVIAPMLSAFKERHDYVLGRLNKMRGVSAIAAQGIFYSFPNVAEAIKNLGVENDIAFAEKMLQDAGVAVVPGSAFGLEGHMRISYATSMANLEKAMDRLEQALA